ncbi:MAG TPA: TonB-dependent receptor [Polyangiaceae bacterium]|nr:TonB-dependent receptor [Polyangiaceae bacterium]
MFAGALCGAAMLTAPLARAEETTTATPEVVVTGTRPADAASERDVGRDELAARPVRAAADLLRATPGLVTAQHSGGGKANQYFLRGFDADHGTDVALSFDGVPINMVSHGHGQGYADTNFIIPEVVERLEIRKGPYFADLGDFATAGALNLVSRASVPHASMGVGFEASPGHGSPSYRALMLASPKLGSARALLAADIARENGPFQHPNHWDRYRLFDKISFKSGKSALVTLSFAGYAGSWNGSGQLPARAVEDGYVSRFGSLDPSEGGASARHQASLTYRALLDGDAEFKALAYAARYRFNLFSNFTLYLDDPTLGDQIEQQDRRTILGAKLSYRRPTRVFGMPFETTLGAEARRDDIEAGLWKSYQRQRVALRTRHEVNEQLLSLYVNERWAPASFVRLDVGVRADWLVFDVTDRSSGAAGPKSDTAAQLSPKAGAVFDLFRKRELELQAFANYGRGFHSNDVRGAFASPRVSPLARAVGAELGARTRLFGRAELSMALFQLDSASETVWSGDAGTTEAAGASRRQGVELMARYGLSDWLTADLDVTLTRARFRDGSEVPLAPRQTWAGGLTARRDLGEGRARAALRFFGVGERPASDDGVLSATGFTELDLALGYTLRRFDFALDVENLLNSEFRSAQFATVSRLANDPAVGQAVPPGFSCGRNARLAPSGASGGFGGCEDVHFTPANPLTVRVMATVFLD